MAKWFKTLWAASGDKTAVPDALDVSGAVSYTEGYNLNYERVLGTDPLARAIERQKLNYVLSDVTGALQQYQTKGFPDYIDAATNGGTAYAYAVNAVVRFTDDKNYINTVAANTNAPNVSGWVLHNDIASTVHAATAKTALVDADELLLIDSAASNVLKKTTWADIKSSLLTSIGAMIASLTTKTTPIGADVFLISDSAASGVAKKLSLTNLMAMIFTSPTITGAPLAPTAAVGTNTTQLATTAFANAAAGGVNTPAASLATNGYSKSANGLIEQWGTTANIPAGGSVAVTFPIPFATQLFGVVATYRAFGSGPNNGIVSPQVTLEALGGFTISNFDPDTGAPAFWFAKGY